MRDKHVNRSIHASIIGFHANCPTIVALLRTNTEHPIIITAIFALVCSPASPHTAGDNVILVENAIAFQFRRIQTRHVFGVSGITTVTLVYYLQTQR